MEQTCDLVSTVLSKEPLLLFQIRMQRSAVPPPLAKILPEKPREKDFHNQYQEVKVAVHKGRR